MKPGRNGKIDGRNQEPTKVFELPSGEKDDDFMIGIWNDGYKAKITQMTVMRYKQMQEARNHAPKAKAQTIFWSKMHPTTKTIGL